MSHIWCECQDTARHGSHHSLPCACLGGHYSPLFCPDELPSSSVERVVWSKAFWMGSASVYKVVEERWTPEFSRCSGGRSTQAQWKNTGTEQGHQGNRKKARETRTRSKTVEHFRKQRTKHKQDIWTWNAKWIHCEISNFCRCIPPKVQFSTILPKPMMMSDGKPDGGCLAWTIVASSFMVSFLQDGFRFLDFFLEVLKRT